MIRRLREPGNGLAHLAGAVLSAAALVVLVRLALAAGTTRQLVAYAIERPRLRPDVFGAHALWHLLVIAGSACHCWAVAPYLTPPA